MVPGDHASIEYTRTIELLPMFVWKQMYVPGASAYTSTRATEACMFWHSVTPTGALPITSIAAPL